MQRCCSMMVPQSPCHFSDGEVDLADEAKGLNRSQDSAVKGKGSVGFLGSVSFVDSPHLAIKAYSAVCPQTQGIGHRKWLRKGQVNHE